jgi:hypothetical protein
MAPIPAPLLLPGNTSNDEGTGGQNSTGFRGLAVRFRDLVLPPPPPPAILAVRCESLLAMWAGFRWRTHPLSCPALPADHHRHVGAAGPGAAARCCRLLAAAAPAAQGGSRGVWVSTAACQAMPVHLEAHASAWLVLVASGLRLALPYTQPQTRLPHDGGGLRGAPPICCVWNNPVHSPPPPACSPYANDASTDPQAAQPP